CSLKGDRTVQVFRAIQHEIQQKYGDVDIPQHFAIEQAPESEQALSDRNAYLAELGITGIWFQKGQFGYVDDLLRLARNELRYRGTLPGVAKRMSKPDIVEQKSGSGLGLMGRIRNRLLKELARVLTVSPTQA